MDQRFKQRLIGAVVLVALAVIFLPMLLSGPAERTRVDIELAIPDAPTAPPTPNLPDADMLDQPEPGQALESQPAPVEPEALPQAAAPAQTNDRDEAQAQLEPAPESEPVSQAGGFFVQVGAFGSNENAQRLAQRLRDDNYDVVVRDETIDERTRHIVWVGPESSRQRAERAAQRLADQHELSGFIVEPQSAD